MTIPWDDEVKEAVELAATHLHEAHLGAILWSPNVSLIFNNGRMSPDDVVDQKAKIRRFLRVKSIEELASYEQGEYHIYWGILVKSNEPKVLFAKIWEIAAYEDARIQEDIACRRLMTYWNKPYKRVLKASG